MSESTKKEISRVYPVSDKSYWLITFEDGSQTREYIVDANAKQQIENDFTYHTPKPDMTPRFQEIREQAKKLAEIIAKSCPNSRNKSSALTQLQLAVMLANASIACEEK